MQASFIFTHIVSARTDMSATTSSSWKSNEIRGDSCFYFSDRASLFAAAISDWDQFAFFLTRISREVDKD